jgi:drug/metabolite transporter (DMT)-like permease
MFVLTGQLIIYGFKYLDSQKGSLLMLLEVVFGVIVGFLVYQETLSWGAVLGGLLILLGVALPNLPTVTKKS